jgi:hypothetical protein
VGLTVAWTLATEEVARAGPEATGLLRLLACCAPEAVPVDLLLRSPEGSGQPLRPEVARFLNPLLGNPDAVAAAVAALHRYSLVRALSDGIVSMHRLVQEVTLGQLPAELTAPWRQATGSLVETALPSDDGKQPATWPAYRALLPHGLIALLPGGDGLAKLADYRGHSGDITAACALYGQVAETRERTLGADNPATLDARASVADWTGRAGDRTIARDQLAALLPVRERTCGREDPGSLALRARLAFWTGAAGDWAAARDQLAGLLRSAGGTAARARAGVRPCSSGNPRRPR